MKRLLRFCAQGGTESRSTACGAMRLPLLVESGRDRLVELRQQVAVAVERDGDRSPKPDGLAPPHAGLEGEVGERR